MHLFTRLICPVLLSLFFKASFLANLPVRRTEVNQLQPFLRPTPFIAAHPSALTCFNGDLQAKINRNLFYITKGVLKKVEHLKREKQQFNQEQSCINQQQLNLNFCMFRNQSVLDQRLQSVQEELQLLKKKITTDKEEQPLFSGEQLEKPLPSPLVPQTGKKEVMRDKKVLSAEKFLQINKFKKVASEGKEKKRAIVGCAKLKKRRKLKDKHPSKGLFNKSCARSKVSRKKKKGGAKEAPQVEELLSAQSKQDDKSSSTEKKELFSLVRPVKSSTAPLSLVGEKTAFKGKGKKKTIVGCAKLKKRRKLKDKHPSKGLFNKSCVLSKVSRKKKKGGAKEAPQVEELLSAQSKQDDKSSSTDKKELFSLVRPVKSSTAPPSLVGEKTAFLSFPSFFSFVNNKWSKTFTIFFASFLSKKRVLTKSSFNEKDSVAYSERRSSLGGLSQKFFCVLFIMLGLQLFIFITNPCGLTSNLLVGVSSQNMILKEVDHVKSPPVKLFVYPPKKENYATNFIPLSLPVSKINNLIDLFSGFSEQQLRAAYLNYQHNPKALSENIKKAKAFDKSFRKDVGILFTVTQYRLIGVPQEEKRAVQSQEIKKFQQELLPDIYYLICKKTRLNYVIQAALKRVIVSSLKLLIDDCKEVAYFKDLWRIPLSRNKLPQRKM